MKLLHWLDQYFSFVLLLALYVTSSGGSPFYSFHYRFLRHSSRNREQSAQLVSLLLFKPELF